MKLKLALAGAGLFGEEHLRVMSRMADVEIAGIADVNAKAAESAAQRYGALDWGTDIIAQLDRRKTDGLIIATPGQTHVPIAKQALERGIPVLVEKPMAMTAAEAATLVEREALSQAFILPGHVLRFSKPHRLIADIVGSGGIGRLLSLTARRYRDDSHALRYPDIDPIMMTMIHDIDLALWMAGAPVHEVLALRNPAHEQRAQTVVTARDRNGAAWTLATAWTFALDAAPPDRLEIVGERGGIDFETGAYLRQYGAKVREIDLAREEPDDPLYTEVAYFADRIRSGRPPETVTAKDAHAGLLIAEAALASLSQGGIVKLPG
ncbi:Gfo/Idh/MocA family protein [Taklimakanibacter deserti]|uniref:Gfo/Idh/MocA family protein n=1 Tax=Taklimakanibacter deserti TaxID=2267839 RepID=UPI000E64761B